MTQNVLMTSCVNGVPRGVGCHFSPSGSNSKNINKSPMLIPILFHEVIINKCICHGFYFVHCIQFSQLSDLDIYLGLLRILHDRRPALASMVRSTCSNRLALSSARWCPGTGASWL